MPSSRDRIALLAFWAEAILAGGNAVGVRFSNRELDPLWGASLRFLLATAVLAALMAVLRLGLPRSRELQAALVYGLFIGGAFSLGYYAFLRIHAGFGQTIFAIVPLATLLLAVLSRQERLRLAAVVGTLLALAGAVVISWGAIGDSVPLLSLLAVLGGMLCFAGGTVAIRAFPPVHPVTMNAVGMATATILLFAGSLLAGETRALPDRPETWAAIAYMSVIGSVVVFGLYIVVVRLWNASRAAFSFVITPVVTVLLSVWLDDEPIGIAFVFGGILVLAGVYVGALRPALAHASSMREEREAGSAPARTSPPTAGTVTPEQRRNPREADR